MYCKNCGEPMTDVQVVCLKCGVAKGQGNSFCHNCANPVNPNASFCVNCGVALSPTGTHFNPNTVGLFPRSIVTAIILTVLTCGIYSLYWFVRLTDEMNQVSGRRETSGIAALLFTIVTCGLYNLYWAYKLGEKRDIIINENVSSGLIYLLFTIFGFGIVAYILAQDSLNKVIDGTI